MDTLLGQASSEKLLSDVACFPTYEKRRKSLFKVLRMLRKKHQVRFLQTRHFWCPQEQRGTLGGFIWSSGLVLVQAYRIVNQDYVLSFRLTQDHDFAFYYRAVYRFIPADEVPYELLNRLPRRKKTYFSDIVFGVVDMGKNSNNKTKEKV